ncbi:MAG: oxidoreductase [Haliea sp.]|uniref:NADH-quinone oxidoreductase subunit B family protein n=1 Tax=Haliea sp. TaxID=1932666 RepID=UPI000C49255D|nr:oxidoreductase [Haliea sp.]MBM69777.1 oxidoreductase [Haliea sp.]|tara:strand:- start:11047 stop:11874 length:828 start_codon:yes stop_codon:yes gene_type:complete
MARSDRPRLAVFKFASCDGCQLSLLDCEDELLSIAERLDIVHFPEASRRMLTGPYDIALVEGSITTAHDRERLTEIREQSGFLVSIGACATAGGLQAMRNFADVSDYARTVYPHPEYLSTLETSTPIADYVAVDYELHGCPVDKYQLLEVVLAFASGRRPQIARESVCMECKARGNVCVLVAQGQHCLGPITQAGCGALCPAYSRGCYGCFGVKEQAQVGPLIDHLRAHHGMTLSQARRSLRAYNPAAEPLQIIALQCDKDDVSGSKKGSGGHDG